MSVIKMLFERGGVLEKNPPKQGLKQNFLNLSIPAKIGFREKSTKTRIETKLQPIRNFRMGLEVLEKNPPKQGLKLLHRHKLFRCRLLF